MGGDVEDGLLDVAGDDQPWEDGRLGIADGIEEVGESGDECRLPQGHAIVVWGEA